MDNGKRMTHRKHKSKGISKDEFAKEIKALSLDASSVRGSDAKVIITKCKILAEEIQNSNVANKKKLLQQVAALSEDAQSEDKMEQMCGKFLKRFVLLVTFGPLLFTLFSTVTERLMRQSINVVVPPLDGMNAIVTGGCGDLGSRVVVQLAEAGCNVVAACRNNLQSLAQKPAVFESFERFEVGQVQVWPLDLDDFSSVESFANRYLNSSANGLDILIHAAGVKEDEDEGCTQTRDGYDLTLQVNYLSPVLLSQKLIPALRKGGDGGRITYVTCSEGLKLPDLLPWPFRRYPVSSLPSLEPMMNQKETTCSPRVQYMNSKLAVVAHSHDLDRRLDRSPRNMLITSNAVDPGALDNRLGRSLTKGIPKRQSLRSQLLGWFPPVWLMVMIFDTFLKVF
jgi:NAD(P)-dependent dehydrogenase (short-subunit alcohol dehydrogenase family)